MRGGGRVAVELELCTALIPLREVDSRSGPLCRHHNHAAEGFVKARVVVGDSADVLHSCGRSIMRRPHLQ